MDSKGVLFVFIVSVVISQVAAERSFKIDYVNNQFLKDGQPFRYISGSLHYFRVPKIYWPDRLAKMVAAGLNAVQTYIEWSQHEPYPGKYNFDDNLDLLAFIKLAQKMGLLVILRPGPYIDAERDMGGFPFWLLQNNPKIVLRSSDSSYIKPMDSWFSKLLPMIKPLLYVNGGPIIAIQVENEYGSHYTCDYEYMVHLRDLFRHYLGNDIVLFTTDGDGDSYLKCGKTQGLYATIDFGPGTNVASAFAIQRIHEPNGPLVNSEYYPGWLDHWAYPHEVVNIDAVIKTLDDILAANASVNMYMFHGGTNFGFTNGANSGNFQVIPTSYDYNAPITEAGDPSRKYLAIRTLISKYTGKTPGPVPKPVPKYNYGTVEMKPMGSLFQLLPHLTTANPPIPSKYPLNFEELGQAYGYVLYETIIKGIHMDPSLLAVTTLGDRANIFINEVPVGILSRADSLFSIPITVESDQKLSIFVENQGRVCYGSGINDFKGLLSNVTLGGATLTDWNITPVPLNASINLDHIIKKISWKNPYVDKMPKSADDRYYSPGFYVGSFATPNGTGFPMDTFVNMNGWYKGVIFVNGFNLGRYWPIVGPQVTLYLPKNILKPYPGKNSILILELEKAPCFPEKKHGFQSESNCSIDLIDTPIINAPTPHETSVFDRFFRKFKVDRNNWKLEL